MDQEDSSLALLDNQTVVRTCSRSSESYSRIYLKVSFLYSKPKNLDLEIEGVNIEDVYGNNESSDSEECDEEMSENQNEESQSSEEYKSEGSNSESENYQPILIVSDAQRLESSASGSPYRFKGFDESS